MHILCTCIKPLPLYPLALAFFHTQPQEIVTYLWKVKCPNYLWSFVTKTQSPGMSKSQMTADLASSTMAEAYCAILVKSIVLSTSYTHRLSKWAFSLS